MTFHTYNLKILGNDRQIRIILSVGSQAVGVLGWQKPCGARK